MFILYASKNQLTVRRREPVTSGSVNVCRAQFEFSPDWDGLTRTAVFRAGAETRSILLDDANACALPREVLAAPGVLLQAGVWGTRDAEEVLPTVWADLGPVLEGVTPGEDTCPPAPDLWVQELAQKGDVLGYTEAGELGLYAGDKLLSSVPMRGGRGEGGTGDHRTLASRDAERQHPIHAITGLEERLEKTMTAGDSLTVADIYKILEVM